ncbi:FHA domain-containing protein [Amnibacterium sp. CER49]|uniref:FHA domain-containing protein n=1 Tax=Amnibacterium sp. CER49 TaxID=3039161 RepID=UPI00244B0620|nr:FHA domain-containing protein [Amnibacterium sp. CER49]MDH2445082.1 FHA domain-containing protein [Amnibacterium sp. CER49]
MTGAFYLPEQTAPDQEWRLLVSERFLGAFGPDSPVSLMSTLWRIAADPTLGLDALVAAVPTRGAGAVHSFAIAALGPATTFVVRGDGCADIAVAGRMRRVDARGNEPWYVAELQAVERFALGPLQRSPGDLHPGAQDIPLEGGVVLGPWLGWTHQLVVTPAPRRLTAPTPVQSPFDTNVLTDLGRRAASLDRHRVEPPPTAPTPETAAAAAFRLGDRPPERVDAPVYVGRQPRSPRVTGPMLPRLVRVDSPSREVSATHIELRPTAEGLVLTDLQSTNGTVVRQPGIGVRRLESGESLPVVPGTLIDIGDGNVIEILPYR